MYNGKIISRKNYFNIRLTRQLDISDRDRGEVLDYISQQFGHDIKFIKRRPEALGVTLLSQETINRVVNSSVELRQLSSNDLSDVLLDALPESRKYTISASVKNLGVYGVENSARKHIALSLDAPEIAEECKTVRAYLLKLAGYEPVERPVDVHVSFGHSNLNLSTLQSHHRKDLGRLVLTTLNLMPAQIKRIV
jgi:hypothetical protein